MTHNDPQGNALSAGDKPKDLTEICAPKGEFSFKLPAPGEPTSFTLKPPSKCEAESDKNKEPFPYPRCEIAKPTSGAGFVFGAKAPHLASIQQYSQLQERDELVWSTASTHDGVRLSFLKPFEVILAPCWGALRRGSALTILPAMRGLMVVQTMRRPEVLEWYLKTLRTEEGEDYDYNKLIFGSNFIDPCALPTPLGWKGHPHSFILELGKTFDGEIRQQLFDIFLPLLKLNTGGQPADSSSLPPYFKEYPPVAEALLLGGRVDVAVELVRRGVPCDPQWRSEKERATYAHLAVNKCQGLTSVKTIFNAIGLEAARTSERANLSNCVVAPSACGTCTTDTGAASSSGFGSSTAGFSFGGGGGGFSFAPPTATATGTAAASGTSATTNTTAPFRFGAAPSGGFSFAPCECTVLEAAIRNPHLQRETALPILRYLINEVQVHGFDSVEVLTEAAHRFGFGGQVEELSRCLSETTG